MGTENLVCQEAGLVDQFSHWCVGGGVGGFSPPSELLPAAAVDGAGNSMPKMRCLRPPDSCYRHTLQYPQHNMIIFKSNSTQPNWLIKKKTKKKERNVR